MENLFKMSFTVKLQEMFYNSWAAADDRALTLTEVARVDIMGWETFLETGCLKFKFDRKAVPHTEQNKKLRSVNGIICDWKPFIHRDE